MKFFECPIVSIDGICEEKRLPPPDFVKIDVEGLEEQVITGMKNTLKEHGPDLMIEMHGPDRPRKESSLRITTLLAAMGYRIWHVQTGRSVELTFESQPRRGHLYCSCRAE